MIRASVFSFLVSILLCVGSPPLSLAKTVTYDLTIAEQQVNFTGKPVPAMTINEGIPGPTLHFVEGDFARIKVHNQMTVETSIHWHGLLVPPGMDGVPLISFPPIAPGTTFTYEFPVRQNGTYWYHSHTSLQEQSGVYGSIVIQPQQQQLAVDRDYVVLLSDWTDENPHQVLRTLKRGSEWFALEKGSAQSLFGAARIGKLSEYFTRELQRMPAMDIADVAYDRFLANGAPEVNLAAEPREKVRLRIIDGSATTFFHLEFAGGPLQIISADGQDVEPFNEQRLLIGVAETYDILVTVPDTGQWELRATAHDGSGFSSVWLGQGAPHPAPHMPLPDLYAGMGHSSISSLFALTPAGAMGMSDAEVEAGLFDQPGMMMNPGMDGSEGMMNHGAHAMHGMMRGDPMADGEDLESLFENEPSDDASGGHGEHDMSLHADPTQAEEPPMSSTSSRGGRGYGRVFRPLATDISEAESLAVDGMDPARPWPPYKKLRALRSTALSKDVPIREVRLTLDGDMERYVWFLNNQALSEADDILIHEGEMVRFIMINRTMMHHPMHLHGHFFRVVNGQGDFSPLKHTVNVAPMSTTVIEFEASEVGDWFFHCHLLYHMKSGMARAVHYESFELTPEMTQLGPGLYKHDLYAWSDIEPLSNMLEGKVVLSNTRNTLSAEVEVGWQDVDDTEWEALLLWNRNVNRFFSPFAGADLEGVVVDGGLDDAVESERGLVGVHYLLPLNIETQCFIATDGEARFALEKEFQLLPRLSLDAQVEYDTETQWEAVLGAAYLIDKAFSVKMQWHSEYHWGTGLQIRF